MGRLRFRQGVTNESPAGRGRFAPFPGIARSLSRSYWSAAFVYLLLAVGATWPLSLDLFDHVAGWHGDNYYFVWLIGWVRTALFERGMSPLFVPFVNYPEGASLACTEMTPVMTLLALPFACAGGDVFGYNVAILLSFVLSGLAMNLWVRRETGSPGAALVAGAIFAFCPYRVYRVAGHLNLLGTMWLPLYFMSLSGLLREKRNWSRHAICTGAMLGLNAATAPYYFYMTAVMSVVFVMAMAFFVRDVKLFSFRFWKRIAVAASVGLPLVALALAPYLILAGTGTLSARSLEEASRWNASPQDFVVPATNQPFWGGALNPSHKVRNLENMNYLGWSVIVLALFARMSRTRREGGRGAFCAYAATCAVAVVLALGTRLHWRWHPVEIAFASGSFPGGSDGKLTVPLPGGVLFKWLPFYSAMRVAGRYGIYATLFLSVVAGAGIARIMFRFPRHRIIVVTAAFMLVGIDLLPGRHFVIPFRARPVDYWLADQTPGAVAQMPFEWSTRAEHVVYARAARKPTISGYFGFHPAQFKRIAPVLGGFPSDESVSLLKELQVRYVVVDMARTPDMERVNRMLTAVGYRRETTVEGQAVFVDRSAPAPGIMALPG